jgi:hypothetical protein
VTQDEGAVPTITFETDDWRRTAGSPDNESATGRRDDQATACGKATRRRVSVQAQPWRGPNNTQRARRGRCGGDRKRLRASPAATAGQGPRACRQRLNDFAGARRRPLMIAERLDFWRWFLGDWNRGRSWIVFLARPSVGAVIAPVVVHAPVLRGRQIQQAAQLATERAKTVRHG